jgi:anti-repressor protein
MQELVKVMTTGERQTVLGRDLHEFLEIGTIYTDWMNKLIEKYEFIINVDYIEHFSNEKSSEGNREVTRKFINHQLTLSMCKEISMIQRTKKGKQARKYFIDCETKLKEILTNPRVDSYQIDNPIERAKVWIQEEEARAKLLEEVKIQETKVIIKSKQEVQQRGRLGGRTAQNNRILKEKDKIIEEQQDKIKYLSDVIKTIF